MQFTESETVKSLKVNSNMFVPSAVPFGVGKQADPQQVSTLTIQQPSTPAALPFAATQDGFGQVF